MRRPAKLFGIASQNFTTAMANASLRAFSCSDFSDMPRTGADSMPAPVQKLFGKMVGLKRSRRKFQQSSDSNLAVSLIYQSANLPIHQFTNCRLFHRHAYRFLL